MEGFPPLDILYYILEMFCMTAVHWYPCPIFFCDMRLIHVAILQCTNIVIKCLEQPDLHIQVSVRQEGGS